MPTGYNNDYACFISTFSSTDPTTLQGRTVAVINKVEYNSFLYLSYYNHQPTYRAWYPFHRYIDTIVLCDPADRAPIRFEIKL